MSGQPAGKSKDVDSAGVYFVSVEEFEGRPLKHEQADLEEDAKPPASEPDPAPPSG